MNTYRELMEEIARIAKENQRSPEEIKLVAVSKNQPIGKIREIYDAGCLDFGESRIQEALPKMKEAPSDIQWHFIGTLQKNKVNSCAGAFHLIHSVDSVELAQDIGKKSGQLDIKTPILIQVNTSQEPSKHGLTPDECRWSMDQLANIAGIEVRGLMTMAPLTDDEMVVRNCFAELRELRNELGLQELSMGMTHDYKWAIAEGATILRIGARLFATQDRGRA